MPPGSQQPDWEVPRNCHTQASIPPKEGIYTDKQYSRGLKTTAVELLDKTIPPHRTYLGLRRRYFLSALTAAIILVILAIGLGVGLNSHSGYVPHSFNQPLSLTHPQQRRSPPPNQRQNLHRRPHILLPRPRRLRHHLLRQRRHLRRQPHPLRRSVPRVEPKRQSALRSQDPGHAVQSASEWEQERGFDGCGSM